MTITIITTQKLIQASKDNSGPVELTLEPLKFTLKPRRFTLEPLRLTLEP